MLKFISGDFDVLCHVFKTLISIEISQIIYFHLFFDLKFELNKAKIKSLSK
jgi:hypothetical protein